MRVVLLLDRRFTCLKGLYKKKGIRILFCDKSIGDLKIFKVILLIKIRKIFVKY